MNTSVLKELLEFFGDREISCLYIIKKNQPQDIQFYLTEVRHDRWFIHPTPVSSSLFFKAQYLKQRSAQSILQTLHAHQDIGRDKKAISHQGLDYIYIPSLRWYI